MTAIASSSPLPLARRDLLIVPIENRGRQDWTIKDPVGSRYFQLRDEERFILSLLDGRLSLDEIIVRFERRFAPRRLRRAELAGFLALLHREGLVAAPAPGQGEQLFERAQTRRWQSRLSALSNVLAIRLPGINPDRWLSFVAPWLAWVFSPTCLAAGLVLLLTSCAVVAVNFGALVERLPRLGEFLGPGNLLWLGVSLAVVKTLHEFGHALTCKHFGGACQRLGIMLLVFTPALYCDVSDAWMFRERWKRIAVSAAGILVELVLAAVATLVWSLTQPGLINTLALNVMFVCSVSTLLINGNPLLRYDGYFVLADWLGTPNLQQQSSAALRRGLGWLLTGASLDQPQFLAQPQAWLLWSYAIAALLYRGAVIVGILWLVDAALRPLGLAVVSLMIATIVVASVAAGPIAATTRFLQNPSMRRQINGRWLLAATLGILFVGAVIALIPLPARVTAPVVLRPLEGRPVYVTTGGVVSSARAAGERVAAGEPIAQLTNRRLELEVAQLASRAAQQALLVSHLALRQHADPALGDQLPTAQKRLDDLDEQLAQRCRELQRLSCNAPIAGTVFPPPRVQRADSDELGAFAGTPLEPHNLGCYLEAGTLVCTIGDPRRMEAVAIVDQADVQSLHEGQVVRLALRQMPGQILRGRVLEISRLESDDLPPQILAERLIPLQADVRPLMTYYQAVIAFEPHSGTPLAGSVGWAKIHVAPQPLWLRAYRGLRGTLRTPW